MPLDDLAGGVFAAIGRFLGSIFVDALLNFVVRGTGYVVCRLFTREVDADGMAALVVGFAIWAGVLIGVFVLFAGGSG